MTTFEITEVSKDNINMNIDIKIPQMDVIKFLQKKGYEVKPFLLVLPEREEFLITEPKMEIYTFTAMKEDNPPGMDDLYLNVFEKEIKCLLKDV